MEDNNVFFCKIKNNVCSTPSLNCMYCKYNEQKIIDNVQHPSHYTTGTIETIDFIMDKNLNFQRGSVVKYVVRAGLKDKSKEIEDLEKAKQYIDFEIKRLRNI